MKNSFYKGQAFGNDYVIVNPKDLDFKLTPKAIKIICDRSKGIGSDGILVYKDSKKADFGLQIFNPDGSEAEKSGNGLRIFARYLHTIHKTKKNNFTVETKGGVVDIKLHLNKAGVPNIVTVQMGEASFKPSALPCSLKVMELINQQISLNNKNFSFTGVSVGNPHAVFFKPKGESWSREELLKLGPIIEKNQIFPNRTNVQLAVPTAPNEITILIWERGAGETQASGSSACAVAAAAVKLGLASSPITIKAPGGSLKIDVNSSYSITMEGGVDEVVLGQFSPHLIKMI